MSDEWVWIFRAVCGLLIVLVGRWATHVQGKLCKLETKNDQLSERMSELAIRSSSSSAKISAEIHAQCDRLARIEAKLDRWNGVRA